jgi:ribosome-binding protein aMBF1 (putative translation factor)
MTWKERFARMKRNYDWSYEQMAEMLGVKADSIRAIATKPDESFPNAWKLSVIVFEKEKGIYGIMELPMDNPYSDA